MKKTNNKFYQRVLALVLAVMLCVGMMPMAAFATEGVDAQTQTEQTSEGQEIEDDQPEGADVGGNVDVNDDAKADADADADASDDDADASDESEEDTEDDVGTTETQDPSETPAEPSTPSTEDEGNNTGAPTGNVNPIVVESVTDMKTGSETAGTFGLTQVAARDSRSEIDYAKKTVNNNKQYDISKGGATAQQNQKDLSFDEDGYVYVYLNLVGTGVTKIEGPLLNGDAGGATWHTWTKIGLESDLGNAKGMVPGTSSSLNEVYAAKLGDTSFTLTSANGNEVTVNRSAFDWSLHTSNGATGFWTWTQNGNGLLPRTFWHLDGTLKTFTVTYTDGVDSETVFRDKSYPHIVYGEPIPQFTPPERKGYTFVGWDGDTSGTVTSDLTFKAKWEKNDQKHYAKLHYEQNADGTVDNMPSDSDTLSDESSSRHVVTTTVSTTTPTRTGYRFLGWSTEDDTKYAAGANIEIPANSTEEENPTTTTLYAVWVACTHEDESGNPAWHEVEGTKTDPTCIADGHVTVECSICGKIETETIDALGHQFPDDLKDAEWTDNCADHETTPHANPECKGHTTFCTVCGGNLKDGTGSEKRTESHNFPTTWTIIPATDTQPAQKTHTCNDCGHVQTLPLNSFILNYNGNGGEPTNSQVVVSNENDASKHTFDTSKDNKNVVAPTRPGYTFEGWSLEDGSKVDSVTCYDRDNEREKTVYAIWKAIDYTVIYKDGVNDQVVFEDESHEYTDGSNEPEKLNVGKSTPAFAGSTTREGYTFTGWKLTSVEPNKDGVQPTIAAADANRENQIIYTAQWVRTYKVTYTWTGLPVGQGPSKPSEESYTANYEVAVNAWFKNGSTTTVNNRNYVFSGWTVPSGITVSDDGKFNMPADDVEIKGEWTEVFTVTYTDGVDDQVVFDDQVTNNLLYGATTPVFVGTPSRTGYTFNGWAPTWTGTVTGDVIYVAQWTEVENNTYTLTYNANGGTGAPSQQRYTGPETSNDFTVSDTTPIRSGYTFTGWNTEANGSGTSYLAKSTITATVAIPDLNLYAQWSENTTPRPSQGPSSTATPTPTPTPSATPSTEPSEPPTDIPDPEPPLTDSPDVTPDPEPSEPPVEIPEEDPPLSEIPDDDPPLAETPDDTTEIDDEEVPLADVPKTGDDAKLWLTLALLSAAGLGVLGLTQRRTRKSGKHS